MTNPGRRPAPPERHHEERNAHSRDIMEAPTPTTTAALVEGMSAEAPARRSGRKRALLAAGSLLGIGVLATSASFTDFGLLDFGGDGGGFGGQDSRYNLQFSTGQEATVDAVSSWVEANPDAENVAPIDGAQSLVPGGEAVYIRMPVLNESATLDSTLAISFLDVTAADADGVQAARNTAYAGLVRVSVAAVGDASATPSTWLATDLQLVDGEIPLVTLPDLAPEEGTVVVAKVELVDAADQDATNAANGGTLLLQARFDGESRT